MINWSRGPIEGLRVTVNIRVPTTSIALASGGPVRAVRENGKLVLTFDLDVADCIVLR